MCGEEQLVLVTPRRMLGLDDVQKARGWDVCAVDHKRSPFLPDVIEIEPFHHERQVDLKVGGTRCACECAPLDYSIGEPAVAWPIERFGGATPMTTYRTCWSLSARASGANKSIPGYERRMALV